MKHPGLAMGKWHKLSLAQQLGNVGSEVGRSFNSKKSDAKRAEAAMERALELLDLTASDPRLTPARRRELLRWREVYCEAFFSKAPADDGIERFFMNFAIAARAAS